MRWRNFDILLNQIEADEEVAEPHSVEKAIHLFREIIPTCPPIPTYLVQRPPH